MTVTDAPVRPPELDITTRAFWARPWDERDAAFAHYRANEPVFWSGPAESDLLPPEQNIHGFWSLTRHDDIYFASRHPEIFSSEHGITMEDIPPEMVEMAQSFIAMDDPRHAQLRGITLDAFKPSNMRKVQGWVHDHVRTLIDEVVGLASGDFARLVSAPMPGRLFGSFFGLPPGPTLDRVVSAGQRILSWSDPTEIGDQSELEFFLEAMIDIREVALELSVERRADPGDDLFSWMVEAEFEGKGMTDDEIGAFFVLLAVAANDTTRHASAHAIHAFSTHPDQKALLLEDLEGRVDGAVEEILRWSSPLLHMRRTATQDVSVRDAEIKAGDKVVLWYFSANRDEEVFDRPYEFDILRESNRHQAFGGGGTHFCLGAALARNMLRALLLEVYGRIPDISAPEADFLAVNFIHGIRSLPATWTPE